MPKRRNGQHGSFAAHLDKLVVHFPPARLALKLASRAQPKPPRPKVKTQACVNRALLDGAD